MRKLFHPIQKLCLGEHKYALDLIIKRVQPTRSLAVDLTCHCSFFQKWQLPYADIWIQEEF